MDFNLTLKIFVKVPDVFNINLKREFQKTTETIVDLFGKNTAYEIARMESYQPKDQKPALKNLLAAFDEKLIKHKFKDTYH